VLFVCDVAVVGSAFNALNIEYSVHINLLISACLQKNL